MTSERPRDGAFRPGDCGFRSSLKVQAPRTLTAHCCDAGCPTGTAPKLQSSPTWLTSARAHHWRSRWWAMCRPRYLPASWACSCSVCRVGGAQTTCVPEWPLTADSRHVSLWPASARGSAEPKLRVISSATFRPRRNASLVNQLRAWSPQSWRSPGSATVHERSTQLPSLTDQDGQSHRLAL